MKYTKCESVISTYLVFSIFSVFESPKVRLIVSNKNLMSIFPEICIAKIVMRNIQNKIDLFVNQLMAPKKVGFDVILIQTLYLSTSEFFSRLEIRILQVFFFFQIIKLTISSIRFFLFLSLYFNV